MGSDATDTRIADTRRNMKLVEEFMKDIERMGGDVPSGLKGAVSRYLLAVNLGTDAAEAANEVSKQLRVIYEDMYSICRSKAGILPGQPQTIDQADEYFVCQAKVDRQWQARNVQKVLDWDDDGSWVRKLWDKWWHRLLDSTGFVRNLNRERNLPEGGPQSLTRNHVAVL